MYDTDTVAAVSTPAGTGGISVIRISGKDALRIADRVFESPKGKKLINAKTYTITYGYAVRSDKSVIDEVLASVMKAPKSYTGEDVVEISCHGGIIGTREILSEILGNGARHAKAGEFTKRAFLNGKIDLCKAESVIDIINATSESSHNISVNQLRGSLSRSINAIRGNLLSLIAHLQVLIDFADEELEPLSDAEFTNGIRNSIAEIDRLLDTASSGIIAREGIKTAIVGKPNVGKSSLLNLLCGDERAIVTDVEGTTRDSIEEKVNLGNVTLRLSDTAGIRSTNDIVESIGVEKSKDILESSDLVIYMTDASAKLDDNDIFILEKIKDKNSIALLNKSEKGIATEIDIIKKYVGKIIEFSVKEKIGLNELSDTIEKMFEIGKICKSDDAVVVNVRHRDALAKARKSLDDALSAIENGIPANITYIDIENAISCLGEITGQTVGEEIVDRIFHNFCVGK